MKQAIKIFFTGVLCIAACSWLTSCRNSHSNEAKQEQSTVTHEHDHDGHNHDGHNHDGHDHDGHDHSAEEPEGNPDEIVLSAEKAAASGVKAETIVPDRFREVLKVSGRIMAAPEDETSIVASVPGIVSFTSPIVEGSRVKKGEVMFSISSKHLQDGDPVQRARIAYETAQKEYERASSLVADKIVSQQEYEAAKSRYETARLSYEALASDKGAEGTAIKSPVSGYVRNTLVKEGDYVSVGTPLAGVVTGKKMFLKADVSERYLHRVADVSAANFRMSYGDTVYSTSSLNGKLLAYGRSTDGSNSYIPVTFSFTGNDGIIPGSYADVWLLSDERENVISLPIEAVTEEQGHFFVYLQVDPTCYIKQEVTLGASDGRRYEILSGLKGGERVVTEGAIHVRLASASNAIPAHTHNH